MKHLELDNWQPLILSLKIQGTRTGWLWRQHTLNKIKSRMNELGLILNIDYRIDSDYNLRNKDFCILLNANSEQYRSWIILNWKEDL